MTEPKQELEQEAPTLGINVSETIKTGEHFGPSVEPPSAQPDIEANALGLLLVNEETKEIKPVNFAFLAQDKSTKSFKKGLRYDFHYRLEVK